VKFPALETPIESRQQLKAVLLGPQRCSRNQPQHPETMGLGTLSQTLSNDLWKVVEE